MKLYHAFYVFKISQKLKHLELVYMRDVLNSKYYGSPDITLKNMLNKCVK